MTIDLIDWYDENADVCGETYDHEDETTYEDDDPAVDVPPLRRGRMGRQVTVQPTREQLRALADTATPGPWEYEWDEDEGEITVRAGTARLDADGSAPGSYATTDMILEHEDASPEGSGEQHAADAEFIAAARTALPQLLDQLDAAEQRIRDLTQETRDERAACLDQIEQIRVRDARIKAVEDVLDAVDGDYDSHGAHRLGVTRRIRRALEG